MSLIKNSTWNIVGYIIPAIITIPALGILARYLGAERFGIFTLAISIVGYASIFDVGLTRAVIREVSCFRDDKREKLNIISSATVIVAIISILAAILIAFFSKDIALLLKIDNELSNDVIGALKILALTIPLFLITQIWLSILEGEERFSILNIYKTITGSLMAALPVAFIFIHNSLSYAVIGLLIGRLIALIMAFSLCRDTIISAKLVLVKSTVIRLFSFGGWMTVSNIISPVMSYFDRFILSHLLGASSVAFYTAPSEIVSRIGFVPGALARAVFPRLSKTDTVLERKKNIKLVTLLMLTTCLPMVLIGVTFSEGIMVAWMGPLFSGTASNVLKILLVGFMFNSLAQIPFASIQARGNARVTAFIHLLELIPYLISIYYLIGMFGILGAAYAWTGRVIIDFMLLYIYEIKFNS